MYIFEIVQYVTLVFLHLNLNYRSIYPEVSTDTNKLTSKACMFIAIKYRQT